MKILQLEFENLNSLYGKWKIDFTDPEYETNGIFAITGPTGAGKSTILDAICLALYDQTPRLSKVSKTENELMSRNTAHCSAEVVFKAGDSIYCAKWSQNRAYNKLDGNLTQRLRELWEVGTGEPISTKLSVIEKKIPEITGMDFDRFTRSVLLAQGKFDTFLKADNDEKAKILEEITGTGIYAEISKHVFERAKTEKLKKEELERIKGGIEILSPEDKEKIGNNIKEKMKKKQEVEKKVEKIERNIGLLKKIIQLKKEIKNTQSEYTKMKEDFSLFEPRKKRLEIAEKAARLESDHARFKQFEKDQQEDKKQLADENKKLPKLKLRVQQTKVELNKSEKQVEEVRVESKKNREAISKMRLLDQKINSKKNAVQEISKECEKIENALKKLEKLKQKVQAKLGKNQNNLSKTKAYLKNNSVDATLGDEFSGIKEKFENISSVEAELAEENKKTEELKKDLVVVEQEFRSSIKKLETHRLAIKKSEKKTEAKENKLQKLVKENSLEDLRKDKDKLIEKKATIENILDYEEARKKLVEGKPCPLCGSKQHPLVGESISDGGQIAKKIDRIAKNIESIEKLQKEIGKSKEKLSGLVAAQNEQEKQKLEVENKKVNIENQIKGSVEIVDKKKKSLQLAQDSILKKLKKYGIKEISEEVTSLLDNLKGRLEKWKQQDKLKRELEKIKGELVIKLKNMENNISKDRNSLKEKQKSLGELKANLKKLWKERRDNYGEKDPDTEEKLLEKLIEKSEKDERNARESLNQARNKLSKVKNSIIDLEKRIAKRTPELLKAEKKFKDNMVKQGFAGESEFLEARMSSEARDSIKKELENFKEKRTRLQTRLDDKKQKLKEEREKELPEVDLAELEKRLPEKKKKLEELIREISLLNKQLDDNEKALEKIAEEQEKIDAQVKEWRKWGKLDNLIGSADGKNYRRFAQGLTFQIVVNQANHQLKQIIERYILVRDEKNPLELNVYDRFQDGEIRSTKNLSGGESFIVSLALALGLSQMSSQNVRVDSLFLDEGFGTLDEENLQKALNALASLHQENKLIGIISHVQALKERIPAQINIIPKTGGKSVLRGPGCQRVGSK
ncbi:MAG: AAA family ATPase [Myxococcota bacterium]